MEGQIEEVGLFATAAAAAAVLDHDAAGRTQANTPVACANCGATVTGAFCGQCGQKADVHRSIGHVVEELVHGVTHFDSRFWRTIPLLLFRPGKLTRDYVQGKRARYIAPVALFLLTILAMFLTFSFATVPEVPEGAIEVGAAQADTAVSALEQKLAQIEVDLAAARADPSRADEIADLEFSRSVATAGIARARAAGKEGGYVSPAGSLSDLIRSNAEAGNINLKTDNPELDSKIRSALGNPELVFYKMKQKGYKLSFLLVPLSLPWMWLLFAWKRDVRLYDHVVFLLYSQSFMAFLLMLAIALFGLNINIGPTGAGTNGKLTAGNALLPLFLLAPVAHMFAQLKEGYALGWFSAAWRTVMLALFAGITILVYFLLIVALGVID